MKILNSYGRGYYKYLLSGIDQKKCYPSVLKYVDAVNSEFLKSGNTTEADVLKLQQIYYRTNSDTAPKAPEYALFEETLED